MAKSRYSKRAIAKKKAQKRKEKRKRREERRAEGPSTFKEMIAYVDEFGQITDTPPEPQVEEVDLESIEISTPKMEVQEEDEFMTRQVLTRAGATALSVIWEEYFSY